MQVVFKTFLEKLYKYENFSFPGPLGSKSLIGYFVIHKFFTVYFLQIRTFSLDAVGPQDPNYFYNNKTRNAFFTTLTFAQIKTGVVGITA